jgi:hypothetical protein
MNAPPNANFLAGVEVTTADGEPLRLGELWATRPVVLTFLRHFG